MDDAFNFRGKRCYFSDKSTLERNTLILGVDEHTLHIIISAATLEGEDRTIYQKSEVIFGDADLDINQQLLIREGQ